MMGKSFEEVVADVQWGAKYLRKFLPPTEGNLHASLTLLYAHLSNLPDELKDALEEMDSIAHDILANKRLKNLHEKAAALLDYRRQLVHAHVHSSIKKSLTGFTKELGFLKIKYPSLRRTITGFLTEQRTLERDLSEGITSKAAEDKVIGSFLYLSEQMRVILDNLPAEEKAIRPVLMKQWNELAIAVINDYRLLKLPITTRVVPSVSGKIISLTQ